MRRNTDAKAPPCTIALETDRGVYEPGQTITGSVECTFRNNTDVKKIYLHVGGTERAIETLSHTENIFFEGDHFSQDFIFFDTPNIENAKVLPGKLTYPFKYTLPSKLPSSIDIHTCIIEGVYYNYKIWYGLKIVIERWNDEEIVFETHFKVTAPLDLNRFPALEAPENDFQEDILTCCCFRRGRIELSVFLPKTGYARGETIPIHCRINNASTVTIQNVEVRLLQIFKMTKRRYELFLNSAEICFTVQPVKLKPKTTETLIIELAIPQDIDIPNLENSKLTNCWIKYFLKVCVKELTCALLVTIGHIALRSQGSDNIVKK